MSTLFADLGSGLGDEHSLVLLKMPLDHSKTYRERKLRNLPHLLRLRHINRLVTLLAPRAITSYADFGCSNGYLTALVGQLLGAGKISGYDHNPENLDIASDNYDYISFALIDLNKSDAVTDRFEFITCFETLEHVGEPLNAIRNILGAMEKNGIAIISVPIEIGWRGLFKLLVKVIIFRYSFEELPNSERLFPKYVWSLVSGKRMSQFRDRRGSWGTHFGFDYRDIDDVLRDSTVKYEAQNRGFTRFYVIRRF